MLRRLEHSVIWEYSRLNMQFWRAAPRRLASTVIRHLPLFWTPGLTSTGLPTASSLRSKAEDVDVVFLGTLPFAEALACMAV